MRCINKSIGRKLSLILALSVFLQTGCGSTQDIKMPYDSDTTKSAYRFEFNDANNTAASFASGLCIPEGDSPSENEISTGAGSYGSAVFFDVKNRKTLYCRNAYRQLYPASLTKVMTALVAMENCDMDKILTADESCVMTANDVQKVGLQVGDTMTLDQALHMLLIYSANDVANLIAVNVGGSVEGFTQLMNNEAKRLGATNTSFINPHGLQDENHYTTAYDMYLIFNEAIKYGKFIEIIGMPEYSTMYKSGGGEQVEFTCTSTDRYLTGRATAPTQATVIGGKTGTTAAAGANLVLLVKDSSGNSYISVVMKADNAEVCYEKTSSMIELMS